RLRSPPPPTPTPFPYTTLFRSAALDPCPASGRAEPVAIIDDVHAATAAREAFELRVDKLGDQRDQGIAHVAHRHEQGRARPVRRSEEHTSELQSLTNLVCRLLL